MAEKFEIQAVLRDLVSGALAKITNSFRTFQSAIVASDIKANRASQGIFNWLKQVQFGGKAIRDTSASVFKFRESFGEVDRPLNQFVNNIGRVVRAIARLRTTFFLLITVFAVRPILNFFKAMMDGSAQAQRAFLGFNERWQAFRISLSQELLPVIQQVVSAFEEFLLQLANGLLDNKKLIEDMSRGIVSAGIAGVDAARIIGTAFAATFASMNLSIKGFRILIQSLVLNVLEGIALVVKAIPKAESFNNSFEAIASGIKEFWNQMQPTKFDRSFGEIMDKVRNKASATFAQMQDSSEEAVKSALENIRRAIHLAEMDFNEMSRNAERNAESVKISFLSFINALSFGIEDLFGGSFEEKLTKNLTIALINVAKKIKAIFSGKDNGIAAAIVNADELEKVFDSFAKRKGREMGATLAKGLLDAFENNLGDTFLKIMQGKLKDLKDVVVSFLGDIQSALAKFAAQKLVTGLLTTIASSALGKAIGGWFTPSTPTSPVVHDPPISQHGGGFFGRQQRILGEAGPEAIIPLRGGKIPVQLSGGGKAVNVTFNIQAIDSQSVQSWFKKEKDTIKKIMISAAKGEDTEVRQAFNLS